MLVRLGAAAALLFIPLLGWSLPIPSRAASSYNGLPSRCPEHPTSSPHSNLGTPIFTTQPALHEKRASKSSTSAYSTPKISSGARSPRTPFVPPTPTAPATLSSWRLPKKFTSVASFLLDVQQVGYWRFGSDNAGFVKKVPASAYAAGRSDGQNDLPALSALYPKGSYTPGNTPQGGIGFYASPLPVAAATNLSLSYSVFFPTRFRFVKGGKLPGLFGGKTGCSGGDAATDCFSARIMFRTGGMGEMYLYAPRAKQVPALCTLKPFSLDGMSIGRGSWTFKTGEWTTITQDIWLNTPGVANGGFKIWINGKLVLTSSRVYLRTGSGFGAFASPPPFLLFDYDNLPDNIIVPNGGLRSLPSTLSSAASPTTTANKIDNRLARRFDELARDDGGQWSELAESPPFTFSGIMFHTFFGGSSTSWASPTAQRTYFNNLSMRINA